MLLFYRVTARDPSLPVLEEQGVSASREGTVRLWMDYDALPVGAGPVLVVDGSRLPANELVEDARSVRVPVVPPDALRNADPYRPPRPVTAGGGYVGCALPNDVALLVIFRRGVWDLPKGTKAPGETVRTCAKREVREEIGVDTLRMGRALGTTRHGYPDEDHYAVKTTHWYLMQTPERSFEPDCQEGIERVARARWSVARRHMGYETLRRHMDRMEDTVRTALADE
ncbi:MAG: NUDIX domain-containing protein [Salinibacter sp.]|uniref:NUDIX domain-containing protein n=1 Tax=Salinibacter sp. TaxID=2065818 RepID=UPI0035D440CC